MAFGAARTVGEGLGGGGGSSGVPVTRGAGVAPGEFEFRLPLFELLLSVAPKSPVTFAGTWALFAFAAVLAGVGLGTVTERMSVSLCPVGVPDGWTG